MSRPACAYRGPVDASGQPVPLRRNRDFQLLWGGQAISLLGSQTSKIAYPLLVLAMTGSPAKAGIAGFAAMLGYLLFPLPAGALADRYDRKRIMIGCDVIRLLAVGSIAVAGWAAHITYVQVLVAGFAEGTASVFFGVAQRAALPMLVHPSQRSVAVSQNEARQNAAQLAGPALGGGLFGLSEAAPFAADALSYLASLVTLPFIKAPMQAPSAGARPARRLRAELGEGLAFTWRQPFLRYSSFFAASVNILLQVLPLGRALDPAQDPGRDHHHRMHVDLGRPADADRRGARAGVAVPGGSGHRLPGAVVERLGPDLPDADHAERTAGPDQQRRHAGRVGSHPARLAAGRVHAAGLLAGRRDDRGRRGDGDHSPGGHRRGASPPRGPARRGPARRGRGSARQLSAIRCGAQVGGEGGEVEHVEQRVAPPLPRRPVVEMPQALVGRVQYRPQHRAVVATRIGGLFGHSWLALQDRGRLLGHGQAERPG